MSSTDDKKVLVVLGATGNQGGSVVRTFLNDPVLASQWHVRGTTRNASSVAAVELSKLGAEMVSASLYSEAELRSAFTDATAIFAVTDFWTAIQDPALHKQAQETGTHLTIIAQEVEETWGRNLAAAASDIPSLERFVFSSLPSVTELSHDKYKHVHHYDGKANIVKNIQQSYPELWSKMSQILVGSYNSNILPGSYFPPVYNPATKKAEFDGPVSPDALWPFINAPISTGLFVKALILDEPVGTILAAFDEWKSIQQIIDLLTRFTGNEFGYVQKTVEEMAAASPIGLELPETYLFASEYGALGEKADGWKNTLTLPSDLKAKIERPSFEKWLQEQDWSSVFEAA